jgi:hypothetical protein
MPSTFVRAGLAGAVVLCALSPAGTQAAPIPKEYRPAVAKGLKWLAEQQQADGRWEGRNGAYPVTMTSLAGMAMLMEGSTLREGKYRNNLRKAADFVMSRARPNGLIGTPSSVNGLSGRYMYEHGFGMLFLASIVGEEDSERRRGELMKVLTKATRYSFEAQARNGGWGYTAASDPGNPNFFDEGSVTITQLQGLRAARNAGVVVPGDAIKKAIGYLKESTTEQGDVLYSLTLGRKAISPALTAAAICCGFSAGDYDSPLVKKWFRYCQSTIAVGGPRLGHDEYTLYYYSQGVYVLGEDRYAKLFPDAAPGDRLTWSAYRKEVFNHLVSTQVADGSWGNTNWTSSQVGPVYVTACYLCILQLDKATLPIYQR